MSAHYKPCPLPTPLGAGLHLGVPDAVYHGDPCAEPSLSSGVARTLIGKSPAHAFQEHVRLGGRVKDRTPAMVLGGYVHALMSGIRDEFELGEFDNYKSKVAQEWRDRVTAEGKTPVMPGTAGQAEAIAKAIRAKVCNGGITNDPFAAGSQAEVTAVWQDGGKAATWCRARYDRLVLDPNGYADVWDWKTTSDVSAKGILRAITDHGYDFQAAFYLRGLVALRPEYAGRTSFSFVFVETEPPYAVQRVCLSEGFMSIAAGRVQQAITRFGHHLRTGDWPDHSAATLRLEPPAWYAMHDEAAMMLTMEDAT